MGQGTLLPGLCHVLISRETGHPGEVKGPAGQPHRRMRRSRRPAPSRSHRGAFSQGPGPCGTGARGLILAGRQVGVQAVGRARGWAACSWGSLQTGSESLKPLGWGTYSREGSGQARLSLPNPMGFSPELWGLCRPRWLSQHRRPHRPTSTMLGLLLLLSWPLPGFALISMIKVSMPQFLLHEMW